VVKSVRSLGPIWPSRGPIWFWTSSSVLRHFGPWSLRSLFLFVTLLTAYVGLYWLNWGILSLLSLYLSQLAYFLLSVSYLTSKVVCKDCRKFNSCLRWGHKCDVFNCYITQQYNAAVMSAYTDRYKRQPPNVTSKLCLTQVWQLNRQHKRNWCLQRTVRSRACNPMSQVFSVDFVIETANKQRWLWSICFVVCPSIPLPLLF